jgi:short-subunit dehydrogenase
VSISLTKVVLIMGASSGIGYAAALVFAKQGDHVAALARRSERLTELEREIATLPAPHGECLSLIADVSDRTALVNAVEQVIARFGRLDVLVANAGVGQRGKLVDAEWDDLETLLRTNIDGVLHSIRAAVPAMQRGGQIVIVSSIAGATVTPYTAAYGASKAFVSSLARSLALELESDGIGVTNLVLGPVATEFNQKRLGTPGYGANARKLSSLTAEQVAEGIVRAVERRSRTAYLRPFDRLVVWLSKFLPDVIGRQALKRYQTR